MLRFTMLSLLISAFRRDLLTHSSRFGNLPSQFSLIAEVLTPLPISVSQYDAWPFLAFV